MIKKLFLVKDHYSKYFFFILFNLVCSCILFYIIKINNLDNLGHILDQHWHFLDLETLYTDPLKSLIYQHSQPPMLNLMVFLFNFINKDVYSNFIIFNILCSSIVCFIIYEILKKMTNNFFISTLPVVVYLFSPSNILYITYPFYPCVTTLGYALLVYSLSSFYRNNKLSILLFCISCIILNLTRTSFSLLHFFLYFLLLLFFFKKDISGKNYIFIIVTFIFLLTVPIKNFMLYNFFGSSSWAPLNIAKGLNINNEHGYFIAPSKIKENFPMMECKNSYHIQDQVLFKQNGYPNMNNCLILEYAKNIEKELLLKYDIKVHLIQIVFYISQYFSTPDRYYYLSNRKLIESYSDNFNYIFLTVSFNSIFKNIKNYIYSIPIIKNNYNFAKSDKLNFEIRIIFLILILLSIRQVYKNKNKLLSICLSTIILHFFSHVLSDGHESNRFFYDIEFIYYIIFGILTSSIYKKKGK